MPKQTTQEKTSKADEILEVGQELIQTVGYDGFSYRDIADRVGIKSASVHYYYPAKTDLARAAARQYREDFAVTVSELETEPNPFNRLVGFANIFQNTLENLNRVCLCGMLASESSSVPEEVRTEMDGFFAEQQAWIAKTIKDGIDHGTIRDETNPDGFAQTFLSALEGAMIMARSAERPAHLAEVIEQLLALLTPVTTLEAQ